MDKSHPGNAFNLHITRSEASATWRGHDLHRTAYRAAMWKRLTTCNLPLTS